MLVYTRLFISKLIAVRHYCDVSSTSFNPRIVPSSVFTLLKAVQIWVELTYDFSCIGMGHNKQATVRSSIDAPEVVGHGV